jgi:hypothetical protein
MMHAQICTTAYCEALHASLQAPKCRWGKRTLLAKLSLDPSVYCTGDVSYAELSWTTLLLVHSDASPRALPSQQTHEQG